MPQSKLENLPILELLENNWTNFSMKLDLNAEKLPKIYPHILQVEPTSTPIILVPIGSEYSDLRMR